jgi:hypothetical protein
MYQSEPHSHNRNIGFHIENISLCVYFLYALSAYVVPLFCLTVLKMKLI